MEVLREFIARNRMTAQIGIIDSEDFDLVKDGTVLNKGYARKGQYAIHQKIMERILSSAIPKDKVVDHINRNRLDNRRCNLRLCTVTENNRNVSKQKGKSSKFKGVYWKANRNKWSAQIKVNRKLIYLGLFENEIDAAKKYNEAAKLYHREFAAINYF